MGWEQAIAEIIKAVMEALKVMASTASDMVNNYESSNEERFKKHQNQRYSDTLLYGLMIVCAAVLLIYFSKQK